jgi:hypothetical protein
MVAVESVAFSSAFEPRYKEVVEHRTLQHQKSLGKVLQETLKVSMLSDIYASIVICFMAQLEQLVLYWDAGKRCGRRDH